MFTVQGYTGIPSNLHLTVPASALGHAAWVGEGNVPSHGALEIIML